MTTHDQRDESVTAPDAARQTPPGPDAGPTTPARLPARAWWKVVKNTVKEFNGDNLTDWSAALTYYGILSIFPGLLVMVSLVGLLGQDATGELAEQPG